jgi:hypothetical protein
MSTPIGDLMERNLREVFGSEINSPFGLLARFEGKKVAYIQFLEDSYGTPGSFKTGVATRFHSDPSGKEVRPKAE